MSIMSKINITHELIAKYVVGNTTAEETELILQAASQSKELREHLDFMFSIPEEMFDLQEMIGQTGNAKVVSLGFVPMWRLAAQNKTFNQGIKTIGDCVVRCEYEILKVYHPEITLDSLMQLSHNNKWMQPEGTPLYNIGKLAEKYNLSVVRRYDCNIDVLSLELFYDCKVIAVVNAEKLYGMADAQDIPNHAVLVKRATDEQIILYDPQKQKDETYTPTQFIEAWKDSQCYMVSIIERGLRQYDPQPIDVTDFPLESEIKDLIEAIAENNHDVWSRQRMDEGWTYGPKRDDDHKKNPDLVPYSDLSESEKEYDRKAARGILELVQRLGYKIVKDKK
jgi:hypothetical protein